MPVLEADETEVVPNTPETGEPAADATEAVAEDKDDTPAETE
jgi:hypothetical protein